MLPTFTDEVIDLIRSIPAGNVTTYGDIAKAAGNPRGARQVARILHTCSEKERLPWWRVVNRHGEIALKTGFGAEEQREMLESEGIEFIDDRIPLHRYFRKADKL